MARKDAKSKKNTKSKKYKKNYGAVLLLDSLGTKGSWKGKNADSVLANWELLVETFKENFVPRGKEWNSTYKMFAFSDTIIFVVNSKNIQDLLMATAFAAKMLVAGAMAIDIYLRGCISIGEFYESPNMILGPAIDEAAQYYEKGDWIGVFTCPSAYGGLTRLQSESPDMFRGAFVKYNVPMKSGKPYNTFAIELDNDFETWKSYVKMTMIEYAHDKLEHSDDVDGIEKWKNTLDFLYVLNPKNYKEN
ncbi:MAG: hypothetical protein K8Q89_08350 [Nitrosarchaeum sp.]|nr:hypothetical protein [Nitrosarchaeum sp.]